MEIATQSCRYEYIRVVEKTNCIDKIYGHYYEWIGAKHPEYKAIHVEYSKIQPDYGGCIVRCIKCGKLSNSMWKIYIFVLWNYLTFCGLPFVAGSEENLPTKKTMQPWRQTAVMRLRFCRLIRQMINRPPLQNRICCQVLSLLCCVVLGIRRLAIFLNILQVYQMVWLVSKEWCVRIKVSNK